MISTRPPAHPASPTHLASRVRVRRTERGPPARASDLSSIWFLPRSGPHRTGGSVELRCVPRFRTAQVPQCARGSEGPLTFAFEVACATVWPMLCCAPSVLLTP
eukprot:2278249-Prymnesium_polylepis.2